MLNYPVEWISSLAGQRKTGLGLLSCYAVKYRSSSRTCVTGSPISQDVLERTNEVLPRRGATKIYPAALVAVVFRNVAMTELLASFISFRRSHVRAEQQNAQCIR